MLDFSDAPYQFFPARPWKPLIKTAPLLNPFLLRFDLGVHQKEVTGEIEKVKSLIKQGDRILFTPNHPTRTDPQFIGGISQQLGIHTSFMAAYDVFLESKLQCWFMQRTGCFSVDREGNDRKAMSSAIDVLKTGEMALTIFPEGNVYHLNDRLTPLLDGPPFIAAKAHQQLKGESEVWIVPVSLKYTQLTDVREKIWRYVTEMAAHSKFGGTLDKENPIPQVLALGGHLISQSLQEKENLNYSVNLEGLSPGQIQEELLSLVKKLAADLETDLEIGVNHNVFILDRVRKIRGKLHNLRDHEDHSDLSNRSMFVYRLLAYVIPYLSEEPTIDRYAETVVRMREDYFSENFKPPGPRKAFAKIGEPISMSEMLDQYSNKAKDAIPQVTKKIEQSLQKGIDEINSDNTEFGSRAITDPR